MGVVQENNLLQIFRGMVPEKRWMERVLLVVFPDQLHSYIKKPGMRTLILSFFYLFIFCVSFRSTIVNRITLLQ